MELSYFCIVITIFIPLFCAGYAKLSARGYNNRSPREFLEKLEGKAKRAHYAQLNSYEVFPPFAVGVLAAHQLHAAPQTIDVLAAVFVCTRILYVIFYIQDQPTLRSIAWSVGFFITVSLFFIGWA